MLTKPLAALVFSLTLAMVDELWLFGATTIALIALILGAILYLKAYIDERLDERSRRSTELRAPGRTIGGPKLANRAKQKV